MVIPKTPVAVIEFAVLTVCALMQVACAVMITLSHRMFMQRRRELLREADDIIADSVREMHADGEFNHLPSAEQDKAMREVEDHARIKIRKSIATPRWRLWTMRTLQIITAGLAVNGVKQAVVAGLALMKGYK